MQTKIPFHVKVREAGGGKCQVFSLLFTRVLQRTFSLYGLSGCSIDYPDLFPAHHPQKFRCQSLHVGFAVGNEKRALHKFYSRKTVKLLLYKKVSLEKETLIYAYFTTFLPFCIYTHPETGFATLRPVRS